MDKKEIQEHQSFPCNQWFQFGKKTFLDIQRRSRTYRIESLDPGRKIKYQRVKDYWTNDLPIHKGK